LRLRPCADQQRHGVINLTGADQRLRQGAQGLGALAEVGNRLGALPGGGEVLSDCGVIAYCRQRLRQGAQGLGA
jgi:hypothetical protein